MDGRELYYTLKVGTETKDTNYWKTLRYSDIPTSENSDWNAIGRNETKNGYRLPTVGEWKAAAEGTSKTIWSGTSTESDLKNHAWYADNAKETHTVKTTKPNEYGLYDMSGNVWEWCWAVSSSSGTSNSIRPLRGGSWNSSADLCKISRDPSTGEPVWGKDNNQIGFRVCYTEMK